MTWASFASEAFRFTAREAATVAWAGRRRTFCARCGTPLTFAAGDDAKEIDVTMGSFDPPEEAVPQNHTWAEDQMPWVHSADGLPTYEREHSDKMSGQANGLAARVPASAISIAPFDPEQPTPLVALFDAQLREHGIATSADAVLNVLALLGKHPKYGFVLTADCDGSTIGVAYATSILSLEHGGWSGWLEEMYVLPSWRGQGVGTRLLAAVVAAAARRGWKALDLEVDSGHRRVISLYARHGFVPVGRSRFVRSLTASS